MATNYNDPLGSDLLYLLNQNDIDPNFQEISGIQVLAQDVLKRLLTQAGSLYLNSGYTDFLDSNYGLSIPSLLGDTFTPQETASLQSAIQNQILQDERVQSATVNVSYSYQLSTLTISSRVVAINGGIFSMVFNLNTTNAIATLVSLNLSQ